MRLVPLRKQDAGAGHALVAARGNAAVKTRPARTAAQLDAALRALELTLDETALGTLDEIFPGPGGGAAPEAYAW